MPKYAAVYNILRKRIILGTYPKNSFLPPEPNLEKEFSVSRVTIRRAVANLASEGFIVTQQGIGTRVLDRHSLTQRLTKITSLTEALTSRGAMVEYRNFHLATLPASQRISRLLGLATAERIVHIHRVVWADGQPCAIMDNYVLPSLVPDIHHQYHAETSLYRFFEHYYGIKIESAQDTIGARMSTRNDNRELKLKRSKPVLTNRRIAYTLGRPFSLSDSVSLPDIYQYEIFVRGRPEHFGEL